MEISFVHKNKPVHAQQPQEQPTDPGKNVSTKANSTSTNKNKVDSAEISNSHAGSFDDQKLAVAKSTILYEVSVGTQTDRIAEIKSKIENGTYDIPGSLLADAMLK